MEDRQLLSTALSTDVLEPPNSNHPALESDFRYPSPKPTAESAALAETFQQLLDGPQRIVDLGGQTWIVPTRITITTQHSGKVIQNGTIKFTYAGDLPRMGGMEIVQGRRWCTADGQTVMFPAGDIELTLRNLVLDGDFTYDSGLQAQNEAVAERAGKNYNLITTITNAASYINLYNVRFQNCGNSAIAGNFRTFIAERITADRVAKHVIGLRGFGGTKAHIGAVVVTNSGNVFDFHNDGDFYDEARPDVAVVRNVYARNIRGRSKVAGNNWSIDGENWWFEQDNVVNLNLYPAFDLAKNPRRFVIDGFVAINFATIGLGTLADAKSGGTIRLSNVTIRNCLAGIKVQQQLTIFDSEFVGTVEPFRGTEPRYQWNNEIADTSSSATWAVIYGRIDQLYAAKNIAWGTNYSADYWVPRTVGLLMQ
jgi:hypothetical protein